MSRIEIAATPITADGVKQAPTAGQADGHMFANDGRKFLKVTNVDLAETRDIKITTPQTVNGRAVEDLTVTVPINDFLLLGPFPTQTYNQPAGGADEGKVYIDYPSAGNEADLTVGVYSF